MRQLLAALPLGLVVVVLACGSSKTTGGAPSDAGTDSARIEGGGGEAGTCRANVGNRPTAAACASNADAGNADCGSGFCTFQGDHFACQNNVACAG